MATGIGDSSLHTNAQENVVGQWSKQNPAAATQWMQSPSEGRTKDLAASGISRFMSYTDPKQPWIWPQESVTPTCAPKLREV